MTLQPGEHHAGKWADLPRFELVDQTLDLAPAARRSVPWASPPVTGGRIQVIVPCEPR